MFNLSDRCALITGGAAGMGRAVAEFFLAEGAQVTIVDVDAEVARTCAQEIGCHVEVADVADRAAMEAVASNAAQAMGGLNFLFNNAGVGGIDPLHGMSGEVWDRQVAVNLTGVFNGMRACIPYMLKSEQPAIVSNTSITGLRPRPGECHYSATKAGVIALTASAALEYAPQIRVNAIAPGFVMTELSRFYIEDEALFGPIMKELPLQRVASVADVANLVAFLASPLSAYITGQTLVVDGGLSLTVAGVDVGLHATLGAGANQ